MFEKFALWLGWQSAKRICRKQQYDDDEKFYCLFLNRTTKTKVMGFDDKSITIQFSGPWPFSTTPYIEYYRLLWLVQLSNSSHYTRIIVERYMTREVYTRWHETRDNTWDTHYYNCEWHELHKYDTNTWILHK